jgi:hypothetical protein
MPGKRYQGSERPTICNPVTLDAYRDLVDEKARDLDYIILRQKEVASGDLHPKGGGRFSRVVGDSNLIRIDFTADVAEADLPEFYEKLSGEIARMTLKYEKKRGGTRVRVILGMRSVTLLLAAIIGLLVGATRAGAADPAAAPTVPLAGGSASATIEKAGRSLDDSWELDNRSAPSIGGGGDQAGDTDPSIDGDDPVDPDDPAVAGSDRRLLPEVYVHGDANLDRTIDISDAVAVLVYLTGGGSLQCLRAADVNLDGRVSIVDPVRLIRFLFLPDGEPNGIGRTVEEGGNDGAAASLPCTARG